MIRTGNRIPAKAFFTSGVGQSDITVHAGSYHLALRDAGIEMCNIMQYSSILPEGLEIVEPSTRVHGEVMETISAVATCEYGSTATAGLIWGWLRDEETGEIKGGLVCEYNGSLQSNMALEHLAAMLKELHENGYEHYSLVGVDHLMRTVTPSKKYGTAVVAICFVEHEWRKAD